MIGMRIVKTGLAVALSAFLAIILELDSPFFAAMAALITMQGNLLDTFSMAKYRILGTIFGAGIGIIGAYIAHGNPVVLGLGIGLVIFLANKLRWNKAIAIASIVFASLMLGEGTQIVAVSINRVIDTLVGISVAVVVNYTISRPRSQERVRKNAREMVHKCKDILGMLICHEEGVALEDITRGIKVIEDELPGVRAELKYHIVRARGRDLNYDEVKARLDKLYLHLALLADMNCSGRLTLQNSQLVNSMYGVNLEAAEQLGEEDIVFNHHLAISLSTLTELLDMLGE